MHSKPDFESRSYPNVLEFWSISDLTGPNLHDSTFSIWFRRLKFYYLKDFLASSESSKNTKIENKRNLTIFDSFTFPSNLRFDEDLGVKLEDVEFAVPNREDIEEYPEVKEVGPEVISELLLTLKMGGKETGCPA